MRFFRFGSSATSLPDKLSRTDYYQIITSLLMLILGAVILIRSLTGPVSMMTLFVGGGFLALGCYRLNFVIRYFKARK